MFLGVCFLLFVFVYIAPALAVMPRLVLSPHVAFAIPLVSAGVVYLVVTLLKTCGLYVPAASGTIAVLLALIAIIRLKYTCSMKAFHWKKLDLYYWAFLACLMLPYFIKLGTEAFEQGDEIYSWNFWAVQHFYQEPLDFSHTGATYPQLFPKLLSFGYSLFNTIQIQCPNKALLGLFSFSMLAAWGSVIAPLTPRRLTILLAVVFYVVVGLKLEQFFNDGYADPIMSSALVVSMALLFKGTILWRRSFGYDRKTLLVLSMAVAMVACFTKQPALMWLAVVLPVVLVIQAYRLKAWYPLVLAALGLSVAGIWLITEGNQFYQNHGVLYLSFAGRSWIEQIQFVTYKYLVLKPLLLVLFAAAAYFTWHRPMSRYLFWAYVMVQMALWLLFGAYQLRLGQHVISLTTLLLLLSLRNSSLPRVPFLQMQKWFVSHQKLLAHATLSLSLLFGLGLVLRAHYITKPGINWLNGGRMSLQRYFGTDSEKIYAEIYQNPNVLVWVPTRYLYGIFYKHTQLATPDYGLHQPYTQQSLIHELRLKKPDYVFTISEEVIDGAASPRLKEVIALCPLAFQVVAQAPNKYDYVTYHLDQNALVEDPCLNQLEASQALS